LSEKIFAGRRHNKRSIGVPGTNINQVEKQIELDRLHAEISAGNERILLGIDEEERIGDPEMSLLTFSVVCLLDFITFCLFQLRPLSAKTAGAWFEWEQRARPQGGLYCWLDKTVNAAP
jgi:hypothetical protein